MHLSAQVSITKKDDDSKEILDIARELIHLVKRDGSYVVKEEIQSSGFYGEIQLLLQACIAYKNFLQQRILPDPRNSKDDDYTKIIKYGTTLIFQLRKFITGESLSFVLAGATKDGALKEKTYTQEQIFSQSNLHNFRVSFSNAQIELSGCIEKLSALNNAEGSLAEQWAKVLKYGFTSNYKQEEEVNDDGVYHKSGPDINVYMKFSNKGRRKTLTYYYMMQGQKPSSREDLASGKAYDRGWMYQWLKMNQDIEIPEGSLTPLLPLMTAESSVRENIAGIKSGDYGLEQYKYRNRRVITFNNMIDILTGEKKNYIGLIPSLELLLNTQNSPAEAFAHLIQDFTTLNELEIKAFVEKRLKELNLT